jgi:medium-chain acyl-[acyl-carrier-protein] hydrolase
VGVEVFNRTVPTTPISSASYFGLTCESSRRLPMTRVTVPRPNPRARLRVFCFPYAGGGPVFGDWINQLPPEVRREIEVCSIHLPGRECNHSEPLFRELSPLLDFLDPAIASYSNLPYAFFGHSMGALICFELARRLRRRGIPGPIHLTVCGHRAPHLDNPHQPIHKLPEAQFRTKLREFGGTPEAVLQDEELMELLTAPLRADFAVCENYSYTVEAPLDCSITAFGGNDDPKVSRDELSAWRAQTTRSFSLRMFPGGHFFLQSAQVLFLRVLAQDLKEVLRRMRAQWNATSRNRA